MTRAGYQVLYTFCRIEYMEDGSSLPVMLYARLRAVNRAHTGAGAGSGTMPTLEQWSN
jgi:hypothetical protein